MMKFIVMKKTLFTLILFLPQIIFSQIKDTILHFEEDYIITPQISFTNKNISYIICDRHYRSSDSYLKKHSVNIIKFNDDYKYLGRSKVKFEKELDSEAFFSEVNPNDSDNIKVQIINKTNNSFQIVDAIFNVITDSVIDQKISHEIILEKNLNSKFVKILRYDNKLHLLYLYRKEKKLSVWILEEGKLSNKNFEIPKEYFRRLRQNFEVFVDGSNSNKELDLSIGHQYYFSDQNLFLISGDCKKEGISLKSVKSSGNCRSSEFYSPIHIMKFDLVNETVDYKEIKEIIRDPELNSTKHLELAFTIKSGNLFYTYGINKQIHLKIIDLSTFDVQYYYLNKKDFESKNLKAEFENYKKNPDKIQKTEITFDKLYTKFRKQPSISVQEIDSESYNITLGNIVFKEYKSFGEWISTFIISALVANLSSNFLDTSFSIQLSNFKNEIPRMYKSSFNLKNKTITYSSNPSHSNRFILENLDYFIDKRIISTLPGSQSKRIFLFRHKQDWRKFYLTQIDVQ